MTVDKVLTTDCIRGHNVYMERIATTEERTCRADCMGGHKVSRAIDGGTRPILCCSRPACIEAAARFAAPVKVLTGSEARTALANRGDYGQMRRIAGAA